MMVLSWSQNALIHRQSLQLLSFSAGFSKNNRYELKDRPMYCINYVQYKMRTCMCTTSTRFLEEFVVLDI